MPRNRSILLLLSFVLTASSALAEGTMDVKTIRVCQQLLKIMKPKGNSPDRCYDQAKAFLKNKNVKIMTGSYQAYFALSENDPQQLICRNFLKAVVSSTQVMELDDAKLLFDNDKAQSLDQAYYSYQSCSDRDEKLRAPSQTINQNSSTGVR